MAAVNSPELEKVVGTGEPFHCTVLPGTKLVPYTVMPMPALYAGKLFGVTEVIPGAGPWATAVTWKATSRVMIMRGTSTNDKDSLSRPV